jgi:glycosyltransferase involved in cell wall biosynthesis
MNLSILFTRFPYESRFGGAEVHTLGLMKGFSRKGNTIEFLGSCKTLLEKVAENHWPTTELDVGGPPVTKWNALSLLWRKRSMRKKIVDVISKKNPDVVFMLSLSEKLLATEELVNRGIRVFWIEHDGIGRWLTKNPWLPLLKKMSVYATIIVVSDTNKKLYETMGFDPSRIITIPNGIDMDRLRNEGENKEKDGNFRIGCIARLTFDKGVDVLINAVADIPEASLDIVGTGDEEHFLREIIIDHHLDDRIKIMSRTSHLGNFYRSLDLFVLPARTNDPFGLVAAEAMMLGVPTIVTDQCGIASYLTNGHDALIVPADDTKALQEAIFSLMNNEEKRRNIGLQGQRSAQKKFAMDAMVDAYVHAIEKV